jgi:PAS domain S-box-containing protein
MNVYDNRSDGQHVDFNSNILIVFITVGSLGLGFALIWGLSGVRSRHREGAERIIALGSRNQLDEVLPDAVIRVDGRGTVRSLNKAAEELFGYERREAQGQPISNMIRGVTAFGDGRRYGKNSALPPFQSSCGIETKAIRKDGSSFPALCIPLKTSILPGRSLVMVRDETARIQRREIQSRSDLLSAAIQGIGTPVMGVNRGGRVLFFNRACERLFGSSISEGISLLELFPESRSSDLMRFEQDGSGYVFTIMAESKALGQEYILLSGARKDERFDAERYGGHVRRFEDLLTKIDGYSELLLTGIESNHPMREDLEQVHDASREAVSILRVFTVGLRPSGQP